MELIEIKNKIYFIREKQIMLDKDLAEFYGVKAIRLREQVKRNRKIISLFNILKNNTLVKLKQLLM